MALAILCSDGVTAQFDSGLTMPAHEARAAGHVVARRELSPAMRAYTTKGAGKTAAAHPFNPGMVITPDKGTMQRKTAEAMGYNVPPPVNPGAAAQAVTDARVEAFTSLPEAKGKVRSAARLAIDHPDMTPEQGRRFLRGAPSDAAIAAQRQAPQATTTATAPADPRAARLAEIRRIGKRR